MDELKGILCKITLYDYTPLGLSRLTFIVATRENKGGLKYTPCRAYGTNADTINRLAEGESVQFKGHYSFVDRITDDISTFVVVSIG